MIDFKLMLNSKSFSKTASIKLFDKLIDSSRFKFFRFSLMDSIDFIRFELNENAFNDARLLNDSFLIVFFFFFN